jgi:type VI secretion system Hcp family effector
MAIDVFLILPRDASGVALPAQDEVHDANLDKEAGYVIELKSYHFGFQKPVEGSGSARGSGRARAEPLVLTKQVDLASASLLTLFQQNGRLPQVKLLLRKTGAAEPYLTYVLENAALVSLVWATSNVDDVAEEHLSLAYEGLRLEYRAQDQSGALQPPVTAVWTSRGMA